MCAVFGLIDFRNCFKRKARERILRALSIESEVRGTDATGFAFNEGNSLKIVKRPVPAHELTLRLSDEINIIHGHTRMTTQGSAKNNSNNHPFPGIAGITQFALAHNGILRNEKAIRERLEIPEEIIETDSFLAVQVLEKYGELSVETIAKMAETVEGDFVFTVLDERNNSYLVRGVNPLVLYKFKAGFYLYASTRSILDSAIEKLGMEKLDYTEIETDCGDILRIDKDGVLTRSNFNFSDSFYGMYYPHREHNSTSTNLLKYYANTIGISPDDIDLLLDFGYDVDEIEDMIIDPGTFQNAMYMALEMCYGEDF